MGGTSLVDILEHPSRASVHRTTLERCVDRKAGGYFSKALVEDAGMTGFQLAQEALDLILQPFNAFSFQYPSLAAFDELRPIRPVQTRIEVLFLDEPRNLR